MLGVHDSKRLLLTKQGCAAMPAPTWNDSVLYLQQYVIRALLYVTSFTTDDIETYLIKHTLTFFCGRVDLY